MDENKLLSMQDVIDAIKERDPGCWEDAVYIIERLPSAERKGEWIEDGYRNYPCVCSACGTPQEVKAKFLFSFCPNCGADMRGEENASKDR